jgi:hypothetical protein
MFTRSTAVVRHRHGPRTLRVRPPCALTLQSVFVDRRSHVARGRRRATSYRTCMYIGTQRHSFTAQISIQSVFDLL